MQEKDNELDSILQEARESYKKRIDELKNSLKSVSENSLEKELKSDLEKFSPFKSQLEGSDSLKYSLSFKPIPQSEEVKSRFRPANSEDFKQKRNLSNSRIEEPISPNENFKNLQKQVQNLEENLERWKKSYQQAEIANNDLRDRLKSATLQINNLMEEASKSKDHQNEAVLKEIHNMKLHYKKKMSRMKEELLVRDSEKKNILNELEIYKQREKDLIKVCENQVKEICDEYTKNMKIANNIHNEEINKIKNSYEAISQSQNNNFIEEINLLRGQLKEGEKTMKNYKENFENLVRNKENLEKIIHDREEYIRELQLNVKKIKNEYENENKRLQDENYMKGTHIAKVSEEMNRRESIQVKQKLELEVQLEAEKIKSSHLEAKLLRLESTYSELHHNFQGISHKTQVLESQLLAQPLEFQKKYDFEVNKYHEKNKNLETELKALYIANQNQANEMETLKKMCAEIEIKQENEIKNLQVKHEENLREIKRIDRYEYLQLSDAFESNKENLKHCENTIEELLGKIENFERNEQELKSNLKRLEENKQEYLNSIKELKNQNNFYIEKLSKNHEILEKIRRSTSKKIESFKENTSLNLKEIQTELIDYKDFLLKNLVGLGKNFQNSLQNLKKTQTTQIFKYAQENSMISNDLRKAHENIEYLEKTLEKNKFSLKALEEENSKLLKIGDSRSAEKIKHYYESFLRQFLSQMNFLEEGIEESYSNLALQVKNLHDSGFFEKEGKIREYERQLKENEVLLEQGKKSIDYYREKLMKIESEKALEINRSKQELMGLEKRLAQVLIDIREQND